MRDLRIAIFDISLFSRKNNYDVYTIGLNDAFHTGGMNHAAHTGGNSGVAILVFLTLW